MSFVTTNSTGQADTNFFKAIPVSGPVAHADGSFTTTGIPIRITPDANGQMTNRLMQNNYQITNAFQNYFIRVPDDAGNTVYPAGQLLISGDYGKANVFVTIGQGLTNLPTFGQLTNSLGGLPIFTTALPGLTNGFIRLLDATNVANALTLSSSNSLFSDYTTRIAVISALTFSSSNFLYGDYTTKIAAVAAAGITNAFATNAAVVSIANQRLYIPTNYDSGGAAAAIGLAATNYTVTVSNVLAGQITAGGITGATATNINNAAAGVIGTNGTSLTFKFSATGTNAIFAIAQPVTNGLASVTFVNTTSNLLAGQITAGGISAPNATNLLNSTTGVIQTNGAPATMKFSAAGTNAILAIAEPLTNGFVDLRITNNAATVDQLNRKANTNSPVLFTPRFIGDNTNTGSFVIGNVATMNSINSDGGLLNSDGDGNLNATGVDVTGGEYIGNGAGIINIPIAGLSTNGSTVGQVPASIGGRMVFTNVTSILGSTLGTTNAGQVLYTNALPALTNGFIRLVDATNVANSVTGGSSINVSNAFSSGTNTFIGTLTTATNNGQLYWTDGSAIGRSGIFFNISPSNNGALVTLRGNLTVSTNLIVGGSVKITGGVTNLALTASTLLQADANQKLTSIANGTGFLTDDGAGAFSFTTAGSLTNQIGNLVQSTNGFATGLDATNLSILGNVAMGRDGASTVFIGGTNCIAFNGAGTGLVTNGALVWVSSLGEYTNFFNGSILTNNTSAWLLQTNGVTLYSLSGSSPIGTYSAINGALPAPTAVYTEAANDHLVLTGYFSKTNLDQLFNGVVTNITIVTTNNFIANNGGFGTNTTLTNMNFGWSGIAAPNFRLWNGGNNGGFLFSDFGVIAGGYSNFIYSGTGCVISGGISNNVQQGDFQSFNDFIGGGFNNGMTSANNSVIAGGVKNTIAQSGEAMSILGGSHNVIQSPTGGATASGSSIGGGYSNTLNSVVGGPFESVIAGGELNTITARFGFTYGRQANVTNDYCTVFADKAFNTKTNSQFSIVATNGLVVYEGGITLTNLNPGAATMALGVTATGTLTTNAVPGGGGGGGSGTVTSIDVAQQGFTSSGAVTTSGTATLTRSADINNLGFGQTNMAFLKVTNTASIGGQATMSALVLTNGFTNQSGYLFNGGNGTNAGSFSVAGNSTNFGGTFLQNALVVLGNQTNSGNLSVLGNSTNFGSATFMSSMVGNGANLTNLYVFDSLTNALSGNNFTLGQSASVRGSSDINLSGLANTPAFGLKRFGELVVVATGDLQITNPVSFHASDGLLTRLLTNGASAEIGIDVQVGLRTNMAIVIFPP